MYQIVLILFVIIAITLIALIMLQQNKNSSSSGIFESRSLSDIVNSRSFSDNVTRLIVVLAVLFFLFSLLLGNMNSKYNQVIINANHQENTFNKK